jgi:hypothetical protein
MNRLKKRQGPRSGQYYPTHIPHSSDSPPNADKGKGAGAGR